MLTLEEILEIYEAGPEAVIAVIQRLEYIIEKQYPLQIEWKAVPFQLNVLFSLIN